MTTIAANVPHVVTFTSSPEKRTPARLREACDTRDAGALAALLPDTISPVAALGRAVKAPTTSSDSHRWVHCGQAAGVSRWIYCSSAVTDTSALIAGSYGAEANNATDRLTVDVGVPQPVADALRAAYDVERGVVEPAKVNAAVSRLVARHGGKPVMPGVYVVTSIHDDVVAALKVLEDLDGVGLATAVDTATRDRLAAPMARAVDDDVKALIAQVNELSTRAKACSNDDEAPAVREGSADTLRAKLSAARADLATWRDRLGLSVAEAERALAKSEEAMDDAVDAALRALEARKAARAAARAESPTPTKNAA